MKKCRDATTEDEKAKHYISILLSSAEYETFVRLMKIMRPAAEAKMQKKEEAKLEEEKPLPQAEEKRDGVPEEESKHRGDDDDDKEEK